VTAWVDELSIGDYVLSGGDLAALIVLDTIARLLPGVLGGGRRPDDSFATGLLQIPSTRVRGPSAAPTSTRPSAPGITPPSVAGGGSDAAHDARPATDLLHTARSTMPTVRSCARSAGSRGRRAPDDGFSVALLHHRSTTRRARW
jgi:hypothetical protein